MYKDITPVTQMILPGKKGHLFSVMRVAAFHHTPKFASASFDGTVRIWTGENQEKVLFFFSEAIEGLTITPDDQGIIVVLGDSSKAFHYDLNNEKLYEIGSNLVIRNIIGTNPGNTKTAFITFDDDVHIYTHKNHSVSSPLFVENVSGDSLVWINDDVLCIPKRNGSIALIDSEKSTILRHIPVHSGLITSICRNGDKIITVSEDGTGKILDLDYNPQFGFKINFNPLSVDYSAQAGLVVVAGDRNLLFVNTETGELFTSKHNLSGCNAVITTENKIIRGVGERDISIFSPEGEKLSQIDGRSFTAEQVAFLKDNTIVIASGDNQVHKLEYLTGQDQILATHDETISSVLHIPSKNIIVAGAYDDSISIWDLTSQSEIKRIKNVPLISALAKSPTDDIFVAACSGDNTIHTFTIDGKEQSKWDAHDDFISSLLFMNDEVIISGSDDGLIKFWKRNGKLISSIVTNSPIKSIGTTHEFDYNVSGHLNGDLIIWEKVTGKQISSHNVSVPIQRIKIIDNSTLLFAAQNKLYRLQMDGYHIVDVQEVCKHTEPIRGIYWEEKSQKIITVDHSIEILNTSFVQATDLTPPTAEFIEEESPSTVIFAPGTIEEKYTHSKIDQEKPVSSESVSDRTDTIAPESKRSISPLTSTDVKHLTKVSEYLTTVSLQIKDQVAPKLHSFGISTQKLSNSLEEVNQELKEQLSNRADKEEETHEKKEEIAPQEEKPDWKSIDWGKRRD
ncbi:MAG: WD40 repeat domain-containing protein [Candidatus Hodarchaeales archaeon]|jgi:WD40 repeat protein